MMDPQSHEISDHAKFQMKRRGISENEEIKHYLVRVVVDSRAEPPKVVTVYRTSRIEKYWREE
jgi:hypothetical protein